MAYNEFNNTDLAILERYHITCIPTKLILLIIHPQTKQKNDGTCIIWVAGFSINHIHSTQNELPYVLERAIWILQHFHNLLDFNCVVCKCYGIVRIYDISDVSAICTKQSSVVLCLKVVLSVKHFIAWVFLEATSHTTKHGFPPQFSVECSHCLDDMFQWRQLHVIPFPIQW